MRLPIDRNHLSKAIESPRHWRSFVDNHDRNLSSADFSGLVVEGLDFTRIDLEGCDFSNSQLIDCDFSRSNLYGSTFFGAQIAGCEFRGSLLTNSELISAELIGCTFSLAELTGVFTNDANFEGCDLSRARGIDQTFLDRSVGDTSTVLPASLDYPEHWLSTDEERAEQNLLARLRAFRGDEVLLCSFDGVQLVPEIVAQRDQADVASALSFLQTKVQYLVEQRFLHNEAPQLFRAISDYYLAMTSSAGEKGRWPLKHFEIDQIRFALEGNSVSAYLEASRSDLVKFAPEKLHIIDQIMSTHHVLLSNLDAWKRYVSAVVDAQLDESKIRDLSVVADKLVKGMKSSPHFDEEIPRTFQLLQALMEKPLAVARSAALGVIRAIESAISAIFSFARRFIVASAEETVNVGSKVAVRATLAVLIGGGAVSVLSSFPQLSMWVDGGLNVLKSLGALP